MNFLRRLLFFGTAFGLSALLTYCSTRTDVTRPAEGPGGPGPLPLSLSAPGATGRAAEPTTPPEPISLETLTPLLATPGFEEALAALESGDAREALGALDRALGARPLDAQRPEFAFLRARLRERVGDPAGALSEFERAYAAAWPLTQDSTLGAARALLALRKPEAARELANRVEGSRRLRRGRLLVLADAARALGDRKGELTALRELWEQSNDAGQNSSIGLRLGEVLITPAGDAQPSQAELEEALSLARKISRDAGKDAELEKRAASLAVRALALLPEPVRRAREKESVEERLERLNSLVDARRFEEAETLADELLEELGQARRFEHIGCKVHQLRAKALAGRRQWGRAVDSLSDVVKRCTADPDLHARMLFLAGRYAASDKRHAQAVKFYAELEAEHPEHRLADDARLNGALSYLSMGVEARFTELLQTMPERYERGDMVVEGVYRLALRRMDKGDWSGAVRLLERAIKLVGEQDAARGQELAGRERYFLARAELVLGRRATAIAGFEEVVRRFPLSYYMLWAYSQLCALEPERAKLLLEEIREQSGNEPFSIPGRAEFSSPGFQRALSLLRVGETQAAVEELGELGLTGSDVAPELVWGVSLAYANARAFKLSHDLPRRRLTDWLARWPSGSWELAWQLAFPRPFSEHVEREAKKNEIEPALVYAVMREESAFDPEAVSIANAYGLMQLIVPTAKMVAKGTGLPYDRAALKRPHVNIALGARALAQFRKRFAENPLLAIPAYNAGPGNARAWLKERPSADFDLWVELIPFLETRRYTKRVLASRATYAFLYGGEAASSALSLPLKVSP